jgi:hypothetical protein
MRIDHASFIRPVSPLNGVDGTVPFITALDADLAVDGAFLRVTWKRAQGTYQLVPLTNVRELHCSEPQAAHQQAAPSQASRPATQQAQPQPKAKAR